MMLEAALGTAKPWGQEGAESSTDSSVWYMLRQRPMKSTENKRSSEYFLIYLFIKMKDGPHPADLIPRATWQRSNNHQSCFTRRWVTIHAETRGFTISNEISPTSSKYVLFTGSNNFLIGWTDLLY